MTLAEKWAALPRDSGCLGASTRAWAAPPKRSFELLKMMETVEPEQEQLELEFIERECPSSRSPS